MGPAVAAAIEARAGPAKTGRMRSWKWLLVMGALGCRNEESAADAATSSPRATPVALEDACRGDDADACDLLGAMFLVGKEVAEDRERAGKLRHKALVLYDEACKRGDAEACSRVVERPCPPAAAPAPAPAAPIPATPDSALPLDAPNTASAAASNLEIQADGSFALEGKKLSDGDVSHQLSLVCHSPSHRVVIRADRAVPHGRVIIALDIVKQAGCQKIAFGVTPAPPSPAPASPPP
jgi:biopolymer transport protein ExbD